MRASAARQLVSGTFACAVVLLVGCDRGKTSPAATRPVATTRDHGQRAARRIISLAPHITEIVFALGQGDRLVGVTSYCNYPPQARRLPRCGGTIDTDLEKILMLRPDLVLIHGQHESATRLCKRRGIRALRTSVADLAGLYGVIAQIGEGLGCTERAARLVAKMKADIEAVEAAVEGRPTKRVFLSITHQPGRIKRLHTTNGRGFVSRMLEAAGGQNVFASTDIPYPQITPAELLRRKPQVIIVIKPGGQLTDK